MKQPPNRKQNFSPSDKSKIILVIIFLGMFLLAFGILVGLLLRQNGFQLSVPAAQMQATPTLSPALIAPTVLVATVTCEFSNFCTWRNYISSAKFDFCARWFVTHTPYNIRCCILVGYNRR